MYWVMLSCGRESTADWMVVKTFVASESELASTRSVCFGHPVKGSVVGD